MSFYKNTNCPVCGKPFEDNDDIVTCPVCGTPHHRECYEKLGKCYNEELHKDGYDYYDSHKEDIKEKNNNTKANLNYYNPTDNSNSTNNTNSTNSEARTQNPFMPTSTTIYTTYDNDNEKIDGKAVSDVTLSVGVNAQSFIPKFKQLSRREKKFKWNWCAFFFSSFYMFFRKMYKAGIAFFTANIVTMLVSFAAAFKFAPECAGIYLKAMNGELVAGATTMSEQAVALQEALNGAADLSTFVMITNISMIILFVIKVIGGMITNTLYKNQIISNINKIEADIENGAKTQNMFMYGIGQMPSEDDLRKLLLVKKGSVSFFAPIIAYFALEAISMIILNFM